MMLSLTAFVSTQGVNPKVKSDDLSPVKQSIKSTAGVTFKDAPN